MMVMWFRTMRRCRQIQFVANPNPYDIGPRQHLTAQSITDALNGYGRLSEFGQGRKDGSTGGSYKLKIRRRGNSRRLSHRQQGQVRRGRER